MKLKVGGIYRTQCGGIAKIDRSDDRFFYGRFIYVPEVLTGVLPDYPPETWEYLLRMDRFSWATSGKRRNFSSTKKYPVHIVSEVKP